MREDWIESSLGEVCKITLGQSPLSTDCNNQKKGLPFFQGKAEFTSKYPIPRVWCAKPKKIANAGSILLSVRAPVGSTNVAFEKCGIGRGLAALEYDLCQDFILFYLKAIEQELDSKGTGTTFRAISGDILRNQKIPLPPLPEQRAIVKKLESLFSSLDAGVADLKKAQQQLKVYRQAVLKKAFEGELTNSEMELISLANLTTILGDGLHGTPKYSDFGEYYFINGNNLREGKIILKPETKRVDKSEFEKYKKNLGNSTILVSINGTIGNTAFYNNENVVLGKSACYFNLNDDIDKYYIRYNLTTKQFLHYAINNATGSTIMNVGLRTMREYLVPVPKNRNEQHQIVKQIESRLSVCDSIEQNIKESLEKAEALRQSILKKAFEGSLLTAEELAKCKLAEDYEPASVLLERIKAEQKEIKAKPSKKKPRHSVAKYE